MATIKHKRGTSDPSTSNVAVGELAINTTDGGLFTQTDGGSVVEIGGSSGGLSSDSQYNTVGGTNAGDAIVSGGTNNTVFGYRTGTDLTTGDHNTFLGNEAGENKTTQSYNTHIGSGSGATESGVSQTFVGYRAGNSCGGNQVVAIGREALQAGNQTGNNSVAVGYAALYSYQGSSTSASVAVGTSALYDQTTATANAAFGQSAGGDITAGSQNTCLGFKAGNSGTNDLTVGSNNICIGYNAAASANDVSNEITLGDTNITKFRVPGINVVLKDNGGTPTNGHVLTVDANGEAGFAAASGGGASALNDLSDAKTDNSDAAIGIGSGALAADDGTNQTIAIGKDALNDQDSGNFNCAVGVESFSKVTSGSQNMGFGVYSGRYNTGSNNVAIGYSALEGSSGSSSGSYHTCIGEKAGEDITSANYCTFIGYRAGRDITDGVNNTFIGALAGSATNTGTYYNTFVGYQAGGNNGNGNQNVFVGADAGLNNEAWDNVFVGNYSGDANTSGTQNTFMGKYSGSATTSGSYNTFIGSSAAKQNMTTGNSNTAVGYNSMGNASGSDCSALGRNAGNGMGDGTKHVAIGSSAFSNTNQIGSQQNNIVIGYNADVSGSMVSNEVTIGDTNITKFRVPGLNFVVKDSTATEDYVLTVDANGEASWEPAAGGGATGGGSDDIFYENGQTVTTNYTITNNKNAMSAGPITINNSVVVTIGAGEHWTIV